MHLAARCSVAVLVGLRLGQYQAPALHHDLLARGRQVLLAAGEVRHGAIELVVRKELRQIVGPDRSEEHTSELQSLMRISYAVFCLKKKKTKKITNNTYRQQKRNN